MPCPRCSAGDVQIPGSANMPVGGPVGFGCVVPSCGCVAVGIGVIGTFFLFTILGWPVAAVVFLGAIIIALLLAL